MSDRETILARNVGREQLVAELRALRPAFDADGVAHMTLFGSRSRGDNRADSDVDLMIDVTPGRKFSLLDLSGVALTVEDRIGLSGNIFLRRSAASELVEEAAREGIAVF